MHIYVYNVYITLFFFNTYNVLLTFTSFVWLQSFVGVAGGSTRAALTQHQARNNNMGDVSAKDGSQETLVNLLALICSFIFIPVITQSFL